MMKVLMAGLVVTVIAFAATLFAGHLYAQTTTPTPTGTTNNVSPTPTPTTTLPGGAPQTGFGQ